jgi:riboflavin synthase
MFTGIIENLAEVKAIEKDKGNISFTLQSSLANELKIDQSVSHNGVCLTVVKQWDNQYQVTAIKETLEKSNLASLQIGSTVNIERCMVMNGRLDGHIVQGHVDATGKCVLKEFNQGSWRFVFEYIASRTNLIVEKGSISINGVSLTVFNVSNTNFEVAIIPYTYEHTNFHELALGSIVNLEFDIIGKYIARLHELK